MSVTLINSRPKFASHDRFAQADEIICARPAATSRFAIAARSAEVWRTPIQPPIPAGDAGDGSADQGPKREGRAGGEDTKLFERVVADRPAAGRAADRDPDSQASGRLRFVIPTPASGRRQLRDRRR